MKYNLKLICSLVVIVLILFIENGFAIRCYQCTTDTDPKCGDPFDNRTVGLTECLPKELGEDSRLAIPKMCRKIRQKGDGRWRQVIRRCASVANTGVTGVCNWGVFENGVFWQECYCSEDEYLALYNRQRKRYS
ncbi:hypothetical protein Trydic_g13788 [Trypoxylus dichotomus]